MKKYFIALAFCMSFPALSKAACYCEATVDGYTPIYFEYNSETGEYVTYPISAYPLPSLEICQEELISTPLCY